MTNTVIFLSFSALIVVGALVYGYTCMWHDDRADALTLAAGICTILWVVGLFAVMFPEVNSRFSTTIAILLVMVFAITGIGITRLFNYANRLQRAKPQH